MKLMENVINCDSNIYKINNDIEILGISNTIQQKALLSIKIYQRKNLMKYVSPKKLIKSL